MFEQTERGKDYEGRLNAFMDEFVYPAEPVYREQMREVGPHGMPQVLEDLKAEASRRACGTCFTRTRSGGRA